MHALSTPHDDTPHDDKAPFARLGDAALLRETAFIDGRWQGAASGDSFAVTDPSTGRTLAHVAALGGAETQAAIAAACGARAGWQALLPADREAILRRWYDGVVEAREDLALIMTLEQGKPLSEARGEIDYAASFIAYYAAEGGRIGVESVTSHLYGAAMSVTRVPVGAVGLVTPWNFPAAMLTRKAAAALAAGCTAVAHPSSETPLSALALAVLAERAGVPPGVFNVVTGAAGPIVATMCADPRLRAMSFTGSTEIGRLIAAQCAPTVKRLIMELGGHAPLVIFEDADIDRAVSIAVDAKFATSGQDCLAANRILVQSTLYDAFLARFTARVRALRCGNGLEPGVEIGPLMHERALAKVAAQVDDAVAKGARLLEGGHAGRPGPLHYAPTVLADVPPDAVIMHEETFGPVAAVMPFDTEAEAFDRANDTPYGLVAYVVTQDAARAARMVAGLDFGMVAVNRVKITGAPVPFGGVKQSGIGREGSRHGLEAFTELKYACLDLG